VALFDPAKDTAERPRAGADKWMTELREQPDVFRLFVELWVHAQRDERVRMRLLEGLHQLRATFKGFAAERSARTGLTPSDEQAEEFATVMIALSVGVGLVSLLDPDGVPDRLLGGALAMLIDAAERRAALAEAQTSVR
jgi:hypothetical protein